MGLSSSSRVLCLTRSLLKRFGCCVASAELILPLLGRKILNPTVPPQLVKRLIHTVMSGRSKADAAYADTQLQLELARELAQLRESLAQAMPDNPAAQGFKVYSQSDEDGIIETICDRSPAHSGTFVEIGCGNGQENNTHYLVLKGWRGRLYLDGDPSNVAFICTSLPDAPSSTSRDRVPCYERKRRRLAAWYQIVGNAGLDTGRRPSLCRHRWERPSGSVSLSQKVMSPESADRRVQRQVSLPVCPVDCI